MPHFLPGQNNAWTEWLKNEPWVPEPAVRGGVKTIYPEYRGVAPGLRTRPPLKVPASRSSVPLAKAINDQAPRDGEVHVLPVQGNVYMLVADGVNLAASIGTDGVLLVNSGGAAMTDKVQAALAQLAASATAAPLPNRCAGATCPGCSGAGRARTSTPSSARRSRPGRCATSSTPTTRPSTSAATRRSRRSGFFPRGGGFGGAVATNARSASVIAHENVLTRMSASANKQPPAYPEAAWPTDTFFDELHKLPEYVNGEAVIIYHAPAATTDADSLVFFRRSEVIHAGSLFSTISYPVIDLDEGGTIQGVIDGLNQILDLAVAEYRAQGGTWIIPEPRPAVGHRRRRLVSQHAGDDSRPRAGPEDEGPDAGAGESGAPDARLRRPLRRDDRPLDHRHVRGRGVPHPSGEETMTLAATARRQRSRLAASARRR